MLVSLYFGMNPQKFDGNLLKQWVCFLLGNYYPATTDVSIDDGTNELVVIVDRAQGASSLRDGELELMVHRRLLHDDAFGVGEALNETAFGKGLVARGTHWITIGKNL